MMPAIAPQGYGYQRKPWERAAQTEENELEEGEACASMDDPNYDPDVAFSYLDDKLQDVLGHFQKEFEGGVFADKLGAKFGGYGSFLPSHERSPLVLLQPKTPVLQNNTTQKSASVGPVEQMRRVAADPSDATPPPTKLTSAPTEAIPGAGALTSDVPYLKETVNDGNGNGDDLPGRKKPIDKEVTGSDQKKFRLCLKTGSGSASHRKNTEIYSGLGLEQSSSPSLEGSPDEDNVKISPEVECDSEGSPLSLIRLMTAYQIPGGSLLTPLPESVLQLSEQKNEPAAKDRRGSMVTAWIGEEPLTNKNNSLFMKDFQGLKERKERPSEKNEKNMELKEIDSELACEVSKNLRKGMQSDGRTAEESRPDTLKPLPKSSLKEAFQERPEREIVGNTGKENFEELHLTKKVARVPTKNRGLRTDLPGAEHNEADRNREPCNSSKSEMRLVTDSGSKMCVVRGQGHVNWGKKESNDRNSLCDKRKTGKETIMDRKKSGTVDSDVVFKENNGQRDAINASKGTVPGQVVTHEKVAIVQGHRKEVSEKKRRQKDINKDLHAFKESSKEMTRDATNEACKEPRKSDHKKESLPTETSKTFAKGFCRDPAKDCRKEHMENRKDSLSIRHKGSLKESKCEHSEREHSRVIKREKVRRHDESKESALRIVEHAATSQAKASNAITVPQPFPADTIITDAGLAPVAPLVVKDNWVCCDACEKWRLLPIGVEPSSLPKKWLCRMLDWLPGMNCCDVSEDETTQALYALYGVQPVQGQTDANQGQAQPLAVSAPVPDIQPVQRTQEAKVLNISKSCNSRKGHAHKSIPTVSGTAKLPSSLLLKNEPGSVKNRPLNTSVQLPQEQDQGKVGISHRASEGNNAVAKRHKDKQKEKEKLNQRAAGHHAEVGDAPSLKLKRMTQDELESEFSKRTKVEDAKSPSGDFLMDANVIDKVGYKNGVALVRSSRDGSKQLKGNCSPIEFRNKMREESLATDKPKDRQRASMEMDYSGLDPGNTDKRHHLTKKRKVREWKEGKTSQQDLPERVYIATKKENETQCRGQKKTKYMKAEGMEYSARNMDGKDERKGRVTKTLISSNQDLLLDEMEEQRRGGSATDHGIGQSQGRDASQKAFHATELLKRDTGSQQPFVSAFSSSSKVELRGSPVESVSSLPPRTTKLEFMASNTRNSSELDELDINCMRLCHPGRSSVDGDAPCACSGSFEKANISNGEPPGSCENYGGDQSPTYNTGRIIADSSQRDTMQLSDRKAKDCDLYVSRIDVGHGDIPFGNGIKFSERPHKISEEKKEQIGIQEKHGDCNLMGNYGKRRGGREKLFRDRQEHFDDVITYTTDKDKREDVVLNGKCNLKLNCSGEGKKQNQLGNNTDERTDRPSFDSDAKQKADSFSRRGKVQTLQFKDGKTSSQKAPSYGGERTSDQLLPGSNIQAETASVRSKSQVFCHSEDMQTEQGHGSGAGSMLNKSVQPDGLLFDASSAVSSRFLRESSNADNLHGTLNCSSKPPLSTGFSITDPEGSVASPIRKEYGQGAANAAMKEAKHLKHSADRLKNTGGNELESTGLYFRAALKFLYSASLFERCNANGADNGETTQSMIIYTSTASLCEFCAVTYERNKEMAAAALAYKCMGVAHMRVVVAKNLCTSRDRHEVQEVVQMVLPGDSPSSSPDSDIDNLNNSAVVEKGPSMNSAKGVEPPHVAGNPVIVGRHLPHLMRILQYVQDVNAAIEAFAKAEHAFVSANARMADTNYRPEGTSAVKRVIDFNFHDVDGLLHLVRLAMEAINH